MNRYLQIMNPAIDSFGLIAQLPQAGRDGGDSAQREGMFLVLSYVAQKNGLISSEEFSEIVSRYLSNYERLQQTCMPGEIRRHVDQTKWYGFNWRMSRDQWTPNAIALGLVAARGKQWNMVLGCFMRLFLFTTNVIPNYVVKGDADYKFKVPDLTVLASWGYMFRWSYIFWPLLLITDLDLLVNSMIWKYRMSNSSNTNTDILNHVNSLLQAQVRMPTPWSYLARKMLPVGKVNALLDSYFGSQYGPAINVIASEVLPKVW
jgi:hypothetical protein